MGKSIIHFHRVKHVQKTKGGKSGKGVAWRTVARGRSQREGKAKIYKHGGAKASTADPMMDYIFKPAFSEHVLHLLQNTARAEMLMDLF